MTDILDYETRYTTSADGEVSGLASVFGQEDLVGDIVAPGAFKRTLAEYRAAGRMPAMLWSHNPDEPIGRWTSMEETSEGLLVKGKLNLQTQRGAEARALLLDNSISGLSIGFRTRSAERRPRGRVLTDLDLVEASLVVLPCAPNARIRSVKESPMVDVYLSSDDGAPETAADPLPPEVLSRIEAVETKAEAVDAIATRLDKIETRLARPGARIEVKDDPHAETKAFAAWCRKGSDGLGEIEKKVLTTLTGGSPDPQGWQTVPEVFISELQRNLVEASPMRSVARVMQVGGSPVKLPKRLSNLAASWVAEEAEHGLDEPTYGQQEIPVYEARVSTEVSNALIEDSAFNIASELAFDFGEAFGLLEGSSFVNGDGTGEPEGFLNSSAFTALSAEGVTADNIIDLFYAVPDRYAARGTWLMRRETQGSVRKLRSAVDGPYIWADSLIPGQPATLLGRPVLEFPDLPLAGGSPASPVIAFGDWNRAFRIVDRVGLQLLRDPYSGARRSVVTFHARRRTGGALTDGAAVKGLRA
jgi:HK97 family phage major capsid protein/HK97 family phage prohead protease